MAPPSDRLCPYHEAAIGSRVGWRTFSVILTIATAVAIACGGMGLTGLLASTRCEARVDAIEDRLDRIELKIDKLIENMGR